MNSLVLIENQEAIIVNQEKTDAVLEQMSNILQEINENIVD
ncbi:hypothetical protein [Alkalibacter mobilis]|nr:hypothetical protein [Alkalibacter mobilis]